MQIQNIFKKNISRPINGVVKADQLNESVVWQELDEYVVTRELDRHFRAFLSSYLGAIDNQHDPIISGRMAVWISGFFGSGKSHFIKILSYLLGNKEARCPDTSLEKRAVEFFTDKIKDPMLLGDIKRTSNIGTDIIFSYIDNETLEEKFVSVLEQGGGSLIPEGPMNPGTMHTIMQGTSGHLGLYRLELQVTPGNGKLSISGSGTDTKTKEDIKIGYDYLKANMSRVSSISKVIDHDYHLHIVVMQSTGAASDITLCSFITFCSGLMGKPIQSRMIILGNMSLGGTIEKASNLAETLQVGFDAGAKRILIPMSSVGDIPTIPGELFAKFQTSFYSDPVDAVYKALGVE
jgi:hypothetical protein